MRNVSGKICRENQNTVHGQYFCLNRTVYKNVDTYGKAGQATHDNMAHARCMLAT